MCPSHGVPLIDLPFIAASRARIINSCLLAMMLFNAGSLTWSKTHKLLTLGSIKCGRQLVTALALIASSTAFLSPSALLKQQAASKLQQTGSRTMLGIGCLLSPTDGSLAQHCPACQCLASSAQSAHMMDAPRQLDTHAIAEMFAVQTRHALCAQMPTLRQSVAAPILHPDGHAFA